MTYRQLSKIEAEKIQEQRRMRRDINGMNWYMATDLIQYIFKSKGYATYRYRFTLNDPVGPDNYVIPMGSLIGYEVGYRRTGKRGTSLYTSWQGDTYREAFIALMNDYKRKNARALDKVVYGLSQYGLIDLE